MLAVWRLTAIRGEGKEPIDGTFVSARGREARRASQPVCLRSGNLEAAVGRLQNLRPDCGRHGTHHAPRRQCKPRRVDVAINEKRHMPDAILGQLQQGSLARRIAARTHIAQRAGYEYGL